MEGITIRPAGMADYDAVEAIMRQIHALHTALRPDLFAPCEPVFPQTYFVEAVLNELLFVAEHDGKIAGLMECVIRHSERQGRVTRDVLYVETLAVTESMRGQGVGTCLMDYARQLATTRGYVAVELQVNARNAKARAFYEKLGFSEKSINLEMRV